MIVVGHWADHSFSITKFAKINKPNLNAIEMFILFYFQNFYTPNLILKFWFDDRMIIKINYNIFNWLFLATRQVCLCKEEET